MRDRGRWFLMDVAELKRLAETDTADTMIYVAEHPRVVAALCDVAEAAGALPESMQVRLGSEWYRLRDAYEALDEAMRDA